MIDITAIARGKECQIRLIGICTGNRETTIPAHYSLAGISGRGIKSPDTCVAWACQACHDVVDGRVQTDIERETFRFAHAEGVIRTFAELHGLGYGLVLVDAGRLPKILPRRYV